MQAQLILAPPLHYDASRVAAADGKKTIDWTIRNIKDIGIYVVANAAAHTALTSVPLAQAIRTTAASSVLYGAAMKTCMGAGVETALSITLTSCLASSALNAARTPGGVFAGPALAAARVAATKALPTGILFAAEWEVYSRLKRRLSASAMNHGNGDHPPLSDSPIGAFALGAASITTLCALTSPLRVVLPVLLSGAGRSAGSAALYRAAAVQFIACTQSKAAWFGTFEALKVVAHGSGWDKVASLDGDAPAPSVIAPPAKGAVAVASRTEAAQRHCRTASTRRIKSLNGNKLKRTNHWVPPKVNMAHRGFVI